MSPRLPGLGEPGGDPERYNDVLQLGLCSLVAALGLACPSVLATNAYPGGPAFACASPAPTGAGATVRAEVRLGRSVAVLSGLSRAGQSGAGPGGVRQPGLTVSVGGGPEVRLAMKPPFGFSSVPGVTDLVPLGAGEGSGPVCLARFAGGVTAVLVGTYSGGAHCCTWVYAYEPGYRPIWQDVGDPGVSLRDYGGYTLVVTADDSFAYAFDAYAGSGMPVRVLELRGGKFVDATSHYPSLVASDARFWWLQYKQVSAPKGEEPGGGLGLLAAWAADECLLGQAAHAWSTLGHLLGDGSLQRGTPGWPTGASYVRQLQAFLIKQGYCPAPRR